MKYLQALAKEKKEHICPFCILTATEILEETKTMIATPARAPYTKDHILIVPKRHVMWMKELSHQELDDLILMIERWTVRLHTRYKNIDIILKDSLVGKVGKTVSHLHFHLIPEYVLVGKSSDTDREFLDMAPFIRLTDRIRKRFL